MPPPTARIFRYMLSRDITFIIFPLRTLIWATFWTEMYLRVVLKVKEIDIDIELQSIFVRNQRNNCTFYILNTLGIVLEEYISAWKEYMKKNKDYAGKSSAYIFSEDKDNKRRTPQNIGAKYSNKIKKKDSSWGIAHFAITNLMRTLVVLLLKVCESPCDVKWRIHGHTLRDIVKQEWSIVLFHPYLSFNDSYNKLEKWLLKHTRVIRADAA